MKVRATRKRCHRGDFMTVETRSRVMARIRGKDTGPEKQLAAALEACGLHWENHARDLPGCPDFVFRDGRVAVFVDGDFWHGWQFPRWSDKLSLKWELKIAETRLRDRRNHQRLRRMGWIVVRVWEHELQDGPAQCAETVHRALHGRLQD